MNCNEISKDIFLIDDFWTKQQCDDFIEKSEAAGYEAATIETEKGPKLIENIRNNNRLIYTDINLANEIWQILQQLAPVQIGNSYAIGLNEMFRFYRYALGQKFVKHIDQSYIRNEVEASYYTFMIYLNDNCKGGETSFGNIHIKPKQGSALIFLHTLPHEGCEVTEGIKYVLRTDIMYRISDYLAI